MREGGTWLILDKAADPIRARHLEEYRTKLAAARQTLNDQLTLARFCQRVGLRDQERIHYGNVFRLDRNWIEARRRLDLVDVDGTLMLPEDAAALRAEDHMRDVTVNHWIPRVVPLRLDITDGKADARDRALAELTAIRDQEAIPALEAATKLSPAVVGKAVVASLSGMRCQAATDSLVRHAVLAQDVEVRAAATDALRPRSIYATAPMLLAYLQLPVDIRFETFFLPDGRPGHRLTLFQEGQAESQRFVSKGAMTTTLDVTGRTGVTKIVDRTDESLQRDQALALSMQQYNLVQADLNDRAAAALRGTSGEDLPADPKAWWEWWANYNEMYSPTEKPVSYMTSITGTQPVRIRYHSCFVPGTKVWTIGGLADIEKIQVGDLVLAKNVETGELAYKQVTATTVGPKLRPLVEIVAGGETLRCTYGHLFWVSGVGWRMAKELEAGQWLHTARGPIMIESVIKRGEEICHNLIVADFNTFFVTERAFLVHDINVRGPTDAVVPGLVVEKD